MSKEETFESIYQELKEVSEMGQVAQNRTDIREFCELLGIQKFEEMLLKLYSNSSQYEIMDICAILSVFNKVNLKKKDFGYIYILKSSHGYKIGKTKDVEVRLKTLRAQLPFELELVHSFNCENMSGKESILHKLFSHKKIKGEWFDLDEDDVMMIKEFKGN